MLRLVGLVAVWLVCLTIALAGGWQAMWLLVYAFGLLVVGSYAWAHLNVGGLDLRRRHRAHRLRVGDVFVEQAVLEAGPGAGQWLPRLWIEIHDRSDLPGHHLDRVLSLGPLGHRVWELRSTCVQRGRFTLGPVWVTSGDPFGLFRASRKLVEGATIIVYPRTVPLARFGRLPGQLPGGSVAGQRAQYTTPNVSSVRDYQPGDPFNHIHWRTTARAGRLIVREFELDPATDIWLVVDLGRDVQAGAGAESTEEYAITTVASMARLFLDQGRSVGLVCQQATIPADRGPRQLERILESLAVVRAMSHLTLEVMLTAETSRFTRSSTLVVVTPSVSERWVALCQGLSSRGVQTTAVLVEAATFGPASSTLLLVSSLAAAHIPTYLVKRGEPIEQALAMPRSATWRRG